MLAFPLHASAQPNANNSAAEQINLFTSWQDILQFGIEKEINELIPMLIQQKIYDVADLVSALFDNTFSDRLYIIALQYFRNLELFTVENICIRFLQQDDAPSEQLLIEIFQYFKASPVGRLQEQSLHLIRMFIADERVNIARIALESLAAHGDEDDLPALIRIVEDPSQENDIRGGAIIAIGTIQHTRGVAPLLTVLADEEEPTYIRQYAAVALGNINDAETIPVLQRYLQDDNARLRASIIDALAQFENADIESILRNALRDSNDEVRYAAVQGYADRAISAESFQYLQYRALHDSYEKIRNKALAIIAKNGGTEERNFLRAQLQNSAVPFQLRAAILVLLLMYDEPKSIADVMRIVSDELNAKNSYFLTTIARELARADLPSASAVYALLLQSKSSEVILYGLQGINRNNLRNLYDAVVAVGNNQDDRLIKQQAQFILARWE